MRELLSVNSVDTEKYVDITQFEGVLVKAMEWNVSQLSQRGYILPGVVEALTALSAMPTVVQSILTGNIASNARAKLRKFRTRNLANVMAVVITGDFEGVLSVGVGMRKQTWIRTFTLTGPTRVVIDVGR
jgi:hypothetical protein